jgi:hypothetical protein
MRRTLLQLVSLYLMLALSAGTLAMAGVDAIGESAHGSHASQAVAHEACEHSAHSEPDDCWTPCLGASHCLVGAAHFAAALPVTAVNRSPLTWSDHLPPPPCYLHERPPRAA